MRPVLAYTTARILVFVASMGVLYLFGARDLLLLGLAVLVSGLVSLVLLSRQRDAVSSVLTNGVAAGRDRIEKAKTAEDPERRHATAEAPRRTAAEGPETSEPAPATAVTSDEERPGGATA